MFMQVRYTLFAWIPPALTPAERLWLGGEVARVGPAAFARVLKARMSEHRRAGSDGKVSFAEVIRAAGLSNQLRGHDHTERLGEDTGRNAAILGLVAIVWLVFTACVWISWHHWRYFFIVFVVAPFFLSVTLGTMLLMHHHIDQWVRGLLDEYTEAASAGVVPQGHPVPQSGDGRTLPPRVGIPLSSRQAQTAPLTQDTAPSSPPLTHPSPAAVPGRSRTPVPATREQLAFNKAGQAIIRPDELLPVIAGYSSAALRTLGISEDEAIRRTEHGDGGRFALGSLVRTLKDARTYPEASYYAKFHTDEDGEIDSIHHGWCFDSFAMVNGHEVNLLQGLRFADTVGGVLSAFFASAILPTIGAYWHGLYDRDYQIVETPKELNELIFGGTLKEASGDTQGILRTPLGLRIQKVDGTKQCTCRCYSETEGLLDIGCTISADGQAYEAVRTILREPEGGTLY